MWNLRQNLYWKKSKLNRHVVSVHEKVKKPFKCDICDHTYSFKSYLTFHVSSVYEKKKPFVCDFGNCQKVQCVIINKSDEILASWCWLCLLSTRVVVLKIPSFGKSYSTRNILTRFVQFFPWASWACLTSK